MKKRIKHLIFILLINIFFISGCTGQLASDQPYIIYSGYKGGTYSMFAHTLKKYGGIKLVKKYSKGSVHNLNEVMDNNGQFGIAQLDIFANYLSSNPKAQTNLKLILPLYSEEFHILTTKNIKKLKDLKNKTISIGPLESGTNPTARIILDNIGLKSSYFKLENSNQKTALVSLLKSRKPQALIFVGGAPVYFLNKFKLNKKKLPVLLSLENKHIKTLIKNKPGYEKMLIPKNTYFWQKKDVTTVGIISVLFCRSDIDNKTVSTLVKNILKNKSSLEKEHVKWKEFSNEKAKSLNRIFAGLFHPAAVKEINSYTGK